VFIRVHPWFKICRPRMGARIEKSSAIKQAQIPQPQRGDRNGDAEKKPKTGQKL